MKTCSVDIIIPVYRPDRAFEELLRRLGEQSVPAQRLILMNTDRSLWKAAKFDHGLVECGVLANGTAVEVHHLAKEEFDHGGTRAQAAAMATAEVLLFMTQDAVPCDGELIRQLLMAFQEDEAVAAAYARQLPAQDCRFLEQYTRSFNYGAKSFVKSKDDLPRLGIKTYFCSNVCAAYRRTVYEQLGGFERSTIFNEDMIFAAKLIDADYRIAYAAQARVIHSHNYSGWQQLQRNFDLAVSQADHPEIFAAVPSEREGLCLVRKTAVCLLKEKKLFLFPQLVWQSGCKYLGYRLGKQYRRLPKSIVRRCTMSPHAKYWKNKVF